MKYELTEEQRHYIVEALIKREIELIKKTNYYQTLRKSERGITHRQLINEAKVIDEVSLIHVIFHELRAI